ncbi:hypothetical protein C1H46_038684 [Malus baccata]|uniref:Uncharacterized protein n=1 Tax=Malus baccata TaxID=106549 RepID=A0A540KNM2_MALBA|nr:hypothetical protein C1H46_038684 [Malus baccata]
MAAETPAADSPFDGNKELYTMRENALHWDAINMLKLDGDKKIGFHVNCYSNILREMSEIINVILQFRETLIRLGPFYIKRKKQKSFDLVASPINVQQKKYMLAGNHSGNVCFVYFVASSFAAHLDSGELVAVKVQRPVVAATEDLFHFILSKKGERVRVFLVRDIIAAADAFLDDEVVGRMFNEKPESRVSLESEVGTRDGHEGCKWVSVSPPSNKVGPRGVDGNAYTHGSHARRP